VWSTAGVLTQLGLGTDKKTSGYAVNGINNSGQVVGNSPYPFPEPNPGTIAEIKSVNASGVASGVDASGPVIWRSGVQTRFNGTMVACLGQGGLSNCGLLVPKP
jgi:hypothetical protein